MKNDDTFAVGAGERQTEPVDPGVVLFYSIMVVGLMLWVAFLYRFLFV